MGASMTDTNYHKEAERSPALAECDDGRRSWLRAFKLTGVDPAAQSRAPYPAGPASAASAASAEEQAHATPTATSAPNVAAAHMAAAHMAAAAAASMTAATAAGMAAATAAVCR